MSISVPASAAPLPEVRRRFDALRWEAFALTWLVYVAFYLVRRNLDGAKPALLDAHALGIDQLAWVDGAYLACYALGQFVAGPIGDWLGARRVILGGLGLAIASNVAFSLGTSVEVLATAQAVNGLAQACGFPLCCKVIAAWFPVSMRGRASSWFLTSYTLGDLAAKGLSAVLARELGWRAAFYAPAGLVLGLLALLALRLKATPSEARLPDVATITGELEPAAADGRDKGSFGADLVELLRSPPIWILIASYTQLKMVRYVFVGWTSVYLFDQLHYAADAATLATLPMTVGGLLGTIATGWLSDRVFAARRAPPVVIEMLLLALVTVLFAQLGADSPVAVQAVLFVAGFLVYGSDAVLSAASAMDVGSARAAASAAGLINGAGSVGAVVSPFVGAWVSSRFGWTYAWYVLAAMLVLSSALLATRWNAVGRK
jgi:sugar phosphate permease